jgi:hypothetical protein
MPIIAVLLLWIVVDADGIAKNVSTVKLSECRRVILFTFTEEDVYEEDHKVKEKDRKVKSFECDTGRSAECITVYDALSKTIFQIDYLAGDGLETTNCRSPPSHWLKSVPVCRSNQ